MIPEILISNLRVLFVGNAVAEVSDDLGFAYLSTNNRFWQMLEYAGITPTFVISSSERKVLDNAKHDGVLNDMYKKFFFEKKETLLLNHRIGLTDLNRRRTYANEDDPAGEPTAEDVQKLMKKIERFKPRIAAFVTKPEVFEKLWKPLFPSVRKERGKQDFQIGSSEIWLLGSASGRLKDTDALEEVFEALAARLAELEVEGRS